MGRARFELAILSITVFKTAAIDHSATCLFRLKKESNPHFRFCRPLYYHYTIQHFWAAGFEPVIFEPKSNALPLCYAHPKTLRLRGSNLRCFRTDLQSAAIDHSATISNFSSRRGIEPLSGWLTATYFTFKLAENYLEVIF